MRTDFWAYPTQTAKLVHWFPAPGEPSGCRRYIAAVVEIMEQVDDPATAFRCDACNHKAQPTFTTPHN